MPRVGVNRMPKLARLLTLVVMLLVLACGAMTIRIDTDVADETEIKHNIQMEASGQIALAMAEEFSEGDLDEIDGNCSVEIDESDQEFSLQCTDLSQAGLQSGEVEDTGLDIDVAKTDLGAQWEYQAVMVNPFYEADEELEENPMFSGENLDAILRLRFHWTVEMPGDVVESNAEGFEGGTATFSSKLGDERRVFTVVSQQDKGGACN